MTNETFNAIGGQEPRAFDSRPYANALGGQIVGNKFVAPADFHTLLARIKGATMDAKEGAAHADSIASTLHGHRAELSGAECARGQRAGLIGEYEDAIDDLVAAINDTRSNLRRISNGIPDQPKSTLG